MRKERAWSDPRVAKEYEARRFRTPLQRVKHRHDVALVTRLLRSAPGVEAVLDLPCGTGRLLGPLAEAGFRVVGGDVSRAMLTAGEAGGRRLVQARASHLPFRDGQFDGVVSIRFLFHVDPGPERVAILAELGRVAGRVVIGEVRYRATFKHFGRWLRSRIGLAPKFRPAAGAAELARELEQAGLELVAVRPVSRLFSDKALFVARPYAVLRTPAEDESETTRS